jgi:hypothetical protein
MARQADHPPVRIGRETQPPARHRPILEPTPGGPGPITERKTAMAEVLPNSRRETIEWFEARVSSWAKSPATIGLSNDQVAALSARLDEARDALDSATALRQASLGATGVFHTKADDMRALGADLIKLIRAFALASDDVGVFAAAHIPPPQASTPAGPPDKPTGVSADILNTGEIKVAWKGLRSYGTQFIVERQMTPVDAPPEPWAWVGHSVTNDFTDAAVPVGFAGVAYRVHAIRAGGTSDASNTATISFGTVNAEGEATGAASLAA